MSAFIVDREHIDVLIAAGLRGPRGNAGDPGRAWHELRWFSEPPGQDTDYDTIIRRLDYLTADAVGQMLWTENVCSVAARYPGDGPSSRPGPVSDDIDAEAAAYTWTDPRYQPTAGEILKAIGCYEYQSCEHDGWASSEALRFCEALRDVVCASLYEGPWEWDAGALADARSAAVLAGESSFVPTRAHGHE